MASMYQADRPKALAGHAGALSATGQLILDEALSAQDSQAELPMADPENGNPSWIKRLRAAFHEFNWAPDLGNDIGSPQWFRGLLSMLVLMGIAISFWPDFSGLKARPAATMTIAERDEWRTQLIAPLALGADTGHKMGPSDAVIALKSSPERPSISLAATMGKGDSFDRVLRRAGIGGDQAQALSNLVSSAVALDSIEPGTKLDIVLGRRASRTQPRPVDSLAFRARFDLNLEIVRNGDTFALVRKPIIVDNTPLRIRGTVGDSLYRSARAAGAPPKAIQEYLKTLSSKVSIGRNIRATDEFDFVVAYKRAETGERQVGKLMYAALHRGDKRRVELVSWEQNGRFQWFDPKGVGEQRGELARPVNGPISSRYGMRRHPILGYRRMHAGIDFRARHGTPIHAASDGRITYAGRKGGFGKYVRIRHAGGLGSGYAHMSRIAVRNGQQVRRGQIIGYVGSTGLSTGPHLHYELYRNGRTINPQSVRFTTRATLSGSELKKFMARRNQLIGLEPGAALEALTPAVPQIEEPKREIDRLADSTTT
ncbi:M23 family metallopeptidase [Alterisphingorhabdus coralli]|uniref:M23 family metallopeptidase n=1 Tax=Alterisphingorhabdus coralli TaxID=3071408 RepID=A0AA97F901_9SPHN|nr:M23 family metallopeptidase [Parasphingorhabdus sp. SCSIO 66989]WOE75252.1 M23 family metallopeptidase [Parasphingorhabdus sp. SCSIO 66989]